MSDKVPTNGDIGSLMQANVINYFGAVSDVNSWQNEDLQSWF